MVSWFNFDFSLAKLAGVFLAALCISCSSSKEAQETEIPASESTQILEEQSESQKDTTSKKNNDKVKLRYKSKNTDVTIPIDPENQEFVMELKGLERQKDTSQVASQEPQKESPDSTILKDSLVQATMAKNIKQVLKDFRRAQNLFYREDYEGALEMVNRSLETQKTADALGLKGSIYFMQDDMSSAKYYWNEAVKMNPDIPVPNIPELESLIKEIKATEDQEEE